MFGKIRKVFEQYGYVPIETPSMEYLETLTGKYGDEGDQLLFKVLNNGDFLAKANDQDIADRNSKALVPQISKRAMRYDLTVPFARFVVEHQNDIPFPFKRYQIQPVWRADRPQKGRYQEFYQCDVDIIGSDSLMYEAELVEIYDKVFKALNIDVTIRLNNRKILSGLANILGVGDKFVEFTVAIDKWDKIGASGVAEQLAKIGMEETMINRTIDLFGDTDLSRWRTHLVNDEIGKEGVTELEKVFKYLNEADIQNNVVFDPKLARGLNYYTGCIFEVEASEGGVGSLGGGGRYDDLTAIFGLKGMSGVGVSFGAERIFDIMEEKQLFPSDLSQPIKLFIVSFDEESHQYAWKLASKLRKDGIPCDLYPGPAKMKKQMKYAAQRNIPFVLIIGEEEMKTGMLTLKDMDKGDQQKLTLSDVKIRLGF